MTLLILRVLYLLILLRYVEHERVPVNITYFYERRYADLDAQVWALGILAVVVPLVTMTAVNLLTVRNLTDWHHSMLGSG